MPFFRSRPLSYHHPSYTMASSSTNQTEDDITNAPIDSDLSSHPAYTVLRGYGKFKVDEKRQLLIPFTDRTKPAIDFFPRLMLDHGSPASKLLSDIQYTGNDEKQRKSKWTADVMANYILRLHILYVDAFMMTEGKPFKPSKAVKQFFDTVDPVVKEAIAKTDAEAKRTKKRSAQKKQTAGRRIQDEIPFDQGKREKQECPACKHHFTMIVVDNRDAMNLLKQQHKDDMEKYERARPSTRGKKPSAPKYPDSEIACYCFNQQCLVDPNGIGCLSCVAIAAEGSLPMLQGMDKQGNRVCNCPVCQCDCAVRFARKDRIKIAQETQLSKEGDRIPSPILIDPRGMVQGALEHGAIHALRDLSHGDMVDDERLERNATAYATQHVIHDPAFQSAKTKKQLQAAVGPKNRISSRAPGKGIHELREQQRQMPDAFSTLYPSNAAPTSSVSEKDKRFYSNGLSSAKLHPHSSLGPKNSFTLENNVMTPHSGVNNVDLSKLNHAIDGSNPLSTRRDLFVSGTGKSTDTALLVGDTESPTKAIQCLPEINTPATDLVHRSRKRAFQQSRNKNFSIEQRKEYRAVTVFTQEKFPIARQLAQLEMEEDNTDSKPAATNSDNEEDMTEEQSLSQKFLETLTEFHGEYK